MYKVLITGAGKIGALIAVLLAESGSYEVHICDIHLEGADLQRMLSHYAKSGKATVHAHTMDVGKVDAWEAFLKLHPVDAVISSLPYFMNPIVAKMALQHNLHYFDLTEDTKVTAQVKEISKNAKTAFVPQCGLAPGFISIAASSIMQRFEELDTVKLRVGALPQMTSNALFYALTWSTDGVINEYGNPCHAIHNYQHVTTNPLEELEHISIDGIAYEAFNTSGGLGSLAELSSGRVKNMNYKTLRYPGHCEKIKILMNDLRLNEDRDTLKKILERAVPKTYQDVVVVYVSVTGKRDGVFLEESLVQKIYPKYFADLNWSAIQVSTASGICAVVDTVLADAKRYAGLVYQEQFQLSGFLENRFGKNYL